MATEQLLPAQAWILGHRYRGFKGWPELRQAVLAQQ